MNRTTRTLSLTEEGRVFLQQARIAIGALDTAMDAVVARKMETRGHVRISTSAAFGCEQLLPVLPGLRARYPGISVEVDFDDRVTDLIADGYDLAIRGGHIVDSSLVSRPVCQLKTVLVASPGYLERCGVPTTPDDLAHHHLIARRFLSGRVSLGSGTGRQPDDAGTRRSGCDPLRTRSSNAGCAFRIRDCSGGRTSCAGAFAVRRAENRAGWPARSGELRDGYQYPHRALVAPRVKATVEYLLETFHQNASLHFPVDRLADYTASPLPSPASGK
jgi:DNA-binding transcriptional LysR family regulator